MSNLAWQYPMVVQCCSSNSDPCTVLPHESSLVSQGCDVVCGVLSLSWRVVGDCPDEVINLEREIVRFPRDSRLTNQGRTILNGNRSTTNGICASYFRRWPGAVSHPYCGMHVFSFHRSRVKGFHESCLADVKVTRSVIFSRRPPAP